MISTDMTVTGAAGAAPTPAVVVRPARRGRDVLHAPTAAPFQGSGLPAAVRPWTTAFEAGTALRTRSFVVGDAAGLAGYAEQDHSNTPGAPPRGTT
jgi:hypothetical protein